MPCFTASRLKSFAAALLQAWKLPAEEAAVVAALLVEANLVGHDSHGVLRLLQYAQQLHGGQIRPGAPLCVLRESPVTALLDGQSNFGHVTLHRALELALVKARTGGMALVSIRGCHHVGRLGAFADRAARAGFGCLLAVNSPGGKSVLPWGGVERRMGTNPLAIGMPTRGHPLVFDATTSVVAEGKVRFYHQRRAPVPPGWIVDADGRPTTDPATFYGDPPGALLPLGGDAGYKGFGLSVMLDVLCGSLSGQGGYRPDLSPGHNGVFLHVFDPAAFADLEEYLADVDRLISWIKSARRRPGVDEILLPGEIEARTARQRERDGIEIPEETWRQLRDLASQAGLET